MSRISGRTARACALLVAWLAVGGARAQDAMPDMPAMNARPRAAAEPRATPAPRATAPAQAALGLADFEQLAIERNPTLRQAEAQIEATLSRSLQAGLYPNPTVGYIQEQIGTLGEVTPTSSGISATGAHTPGELVGGFVQQEFIMGGKLRLSRAKFAEESNAARAQALAQQYRVLNGVRVRYFEVLAAQWLVAIETEMAGLNDEAVRTTEELLNVGQANEPDLLQARIEARRARVRRRNAENHRREAWEHLITQVNAPELAPMDLDLRLLDGPAAPIDSGAILADLLERSPEIHAALSEIRRSHIMVERERREPIPNVTVQAVVGRNYEFNNLTTAGVQVSLPVPVFNRNQGTVREARADLARDHAELDRVSLNLRRRLAETSAQYNDALASVEDFRSETLPLARKAYRAQMTNFRNRRAAWPQVLVAQRTLIELSREYVQSLLELRKAETALKGMLLIDGLSPPETPTPQGHIESVPTPR